MALVVRMPEVLTGATEAALQSWLVAVGDAVTVGQPIAEVETEKATVEYEAEAAGTIAGLLIGRFIDRKLDIQPAFTIVFLVLGFAAGVREVAIVLKRANAQNDGDKRDRNAP